MTAKRTRAPRRPDQVKVRGTFDVTGWVSDRPDLELRVTPANGRALVDALCEALRYWP